MVAVLVRAESRSVPRDRPTGRALTTKCFARLVVPINNSFCAVGLRSQFLFRHFQYSLTPYEQLFSNWPTSKTPTKRRNRERESLEGHPHLVPLRRPKEFGLGRAAAGLAGLGLGLGARGVLLKQGLGAAEAARREDGRRVGTGGGGGGRLLLRLLAV